MSHEHHEHDHHCIDSAKLQSDAKHAAHINIGAGIIKTALGIFARSPVLVTDGVHDFGDADTYRSDGAAIAESDATKKSERKIKAANKLGGYAIAGTGLELASELLWKRPVYPGLSLAGGILSLGINYYVHRRFAHHDHDDADQIKGHARTDLWTSLATIGSSAAAFAWPPAMLIGSIAHVGLFVNQSRKVRKKYATV